jgi:hypothetical protein
MRKILISIFLLTTFIGCDKKESGNLKYVDTILGGCFLNSSSSSIEGDSILIKILTTQVGLCNCICYYTFNFKFSGNANFYKYHVSGSNLNLNGQIKP